MASWQQLIHNSSSRKPSVRRALSLMTALSRAPRREDDGSGGEGQSHRGAGGE